MKNVFCVAAASIAMLACIDAAKAEVNCNQIRLYAKTGRSEQDIAETMIVDVEAVRKCLKEQPASPPATPQAGQQ